MNRNKLTLASLGSLMSDVDRMLGRICENITDPDTSASEARALTITIKIKPDSHRRHAIVMYGIKSVFGNPAPGLITAHIARDERRQLSLFNAEPGDTLETEVMQ